MRRSACAFGTFEEHVVGRVAAEVDGAVEGDAESVFEDVVERGLRLCGSPREFR